MEGVPAPGKLPNIETDPRVLALCAEFDVRIIEKTRYPEAGETRAGTTIRRILDKHGDGHVRLVLSTLTETEGQKAILDETLLWATSDLVRACAGIVEARTSDWLAFWDACPVGPLQFITMRLSGTVRQREALAGMIFERIHEAFGDEAFG